MVHLLDEYHRGAGPDSNVCTMYHHSPSAEAYTYTTYIAVPTHDTQAEICAHRERAQRDITRLFLYFPLA